MSKSKSQHKICRDDFDRVLVTETLPFETPLIFSNDGLYEKIRNLETTEAIHQRLIRKLVLGENDSEKVQYTIPYLYKIRKNSSEFRRLALIHPRAQWLVRQFYKKYDSLIAHYCSQSQASIRAPHKVAASFFVKNELENLNQYKSGAVSLTTSDHLTRHAPSYFAYKGFDRLYKFFDSRDYFDLEKQYTTMATLDVSKCFDSIYTHTISWAVKDKEFTKRNMPMTGTFADEFDGLMMYANHKETNGIVIGPEVSRVFAEIIFQEADVRTIGRLRDEFNLVFGKDYTFRRYVDDVYIFTESAADADKVYDVYADVLLEFNLHANAAKRTIKSRPFVSDKTRVILAASELVNAFVDKFLDSVDGGRSLKPKQIYSPFRLTRSFVESIKVLCSYNNVTYDEVSAYLIAVLTERVKRLVAVEKSVEDASEAKNYRDALIVLLDTLFFIYEVSPSVGASYKFCTSIILSIGFAKNHISAHFPTIAQRVYELTEGILNGLEPRGHASVQGYLPLEVLNIVLAARELGNGFLLPINTVRKLFCSSPKHSYFSIVSCLFYIRNDSIYEELKKDLFVAAFGLLGDLKDVRTNGEKAYLLLDLLSCPFAPVKVRHRLLRAACTALSLGNPTNAELSTSLTAALNYSAHVNWMDVDLLSKLEKKELKRAY